MNNAHVQAYLTAITTYNPYSSVKNNRVNALKAIEANKCGKQSQPCANKMRKHSCCMFDYVLTLSLSLGLFHS